MTEYVSSLGGFRSNPVPFDYAGPAGALPGVDSATGFQAAALFLARMLEPASTFETLWSSGNLAGAGGWHISVQTSAVVGAPPDAIDVIGFAAGVAPASAVATLLNPLPGVPILAHMIVTNVANVLTVDLYINGTRAASGVGTGPYAPAVDGPVVGGHVDGTFPAESSRVLGTMYHEGAAPAGVTPASFYVACREAKDMVWGLDTVGAPASDWTARYSVRERLAAAAVPPAVWVPSSGNVELARNGGVNTPLNVRGHKNLDWNAALFATLAR